MEEFIFEKQKKTIDTGEDLKKHDEKIRTKFWDFKNGEFKFIFKEINPDELTHEDLLAFERVMEDKFTEDEFESYYKTIGLYCESQREKSGSFDEFHDSRANLRAWISNRILCLDPEYKDSHYKKRAA